MVLATIWGTLFGNGQDTTTSTPTHASMEPQSATTTAPGNAATSLPANSSVFGHLPLTLLTDPTSQMEQIRISTPSTNDDDQVWITMDDGSKQQIPRNIYSAVIAKNSSRRQRHKSREKIAKRKIRDRNAIRYVNNQASADIDSDDTAEWDADDETPAQTKKRRLEQATNHYVQRTGAAVTYGHLRQALVKANLGKTSSAFDYNQYSTNPSSPFLRLDEPLCEKFRRHDVSNSTILLVAKKIMKFSEDSGGPRGDQRIPHARNDKHTYRFGVAQILKNALRNAYDIPFPELREETAGINARLVWQKPHTEFIRNHQVNNLAGSISVVIFGHQNNRNKHKSYIAPLQTFQHTKEFYTIALPIIALLSHTHNMDFCRWNTEQVLEANPERYEYTLNGKLDSIHRRGKVYSFERLFQLYENNGSKWDGLEGVVADCRGGLNYNHALSSIRLYPRLAKMILKPRYGHELTEFENKSMQLAVAKIEKAPLRVDIANEDAFFAHRFANKRCSAQAAREQEGTDIDITEEDLEKLLRLPCKINGLNFEHAR
jgi:hypothetical protein